MRKPARAAIAGEEDWLRDERDLMVALAPYHHCATQLRLDVPAVFEGARVSVRRRFVGRHRVRPPD